MIPIVKKDLEIKQEVEKIVRRQLKGLPRDVERKMTQALREIREQGDRALVKWVQKIDNVKVKKAEDLLVTQEEMTAAYEKVDKSFFPALNKVRKNVEDFQRQCLKSRLFLQEEKIPVTIKNCWLWEREKGVILGQKTEPIQSVGIYVPGGQAAYPSSVLMTVIPAQIAGVARIAIATPPRKQVNPYVLVTAHQLGVKEVYKMGGAHAVAALGFGTQSIPAVDKVVGPGSVYVNFGKQQVFGRADVDMLAGPSEIVIIADRSAKPSYLAYDMLAQAEHGPDSFAILIALSDSIARRSLTALKQAFKKCPRKQILQKALQHSRIFVVKSLEEAMHIANQIAPEHLCLQVKPYFSALELVKNAGAVFLGNYACVSAGDYVAGTSHVLPTGGTARFFSALSVHDFMKTSHVIFYTREELLSDRDEIVKFAEVEDLPTHGQAVDVRM